MHFRYCATLCHTVHFRYCATLWEEIEVSCLGMTYPQILYYLESLEREIFDHTMLLRYCAILLKEIGMNFLGMNYPVDIICSVFIES